MGDRSAFADTRKLLIRHDFPRRVKHNRDRPALVALVRGPSFDANYLNHVAYIRHKVVLWENMRSAARLFLVTATAVTAVIALARGVV